MGVVVDGGAECDQVRSRSFTRVVFAGAHPWCIPLLFCPELVAGPHSLLLQNALPGSPLQSSNGRQHVRPDYIASSLPILIPCSLILFHSPSIVALRSSRLRPLSRISAGQSSSTRLSATGAAQIRPSSFRLIPAGAQRSSSASSASRSALLRSSLCCHHSYHCLSPPRSDRRGASFSSSTASPQHVSALPPLVDTGASSACFLAGEPKPRRRASVMQHLSS